jgi:hypothetical protein
MLVTLLRDKKIEREKKTMFNHSIFFFDKGKEKKKPHNKTHQ